MNRFWKWVWVLWCLWAFIACGDGAYAPSVQELSEERAQTVDEELSVDTTTNIPFARTFRHPVAGFNTSDYGFGFGHTNQWFCLKTAPDGSCASYGAHLGRDTRVASTPEGTEVLAPADGIVRVTTDIPFGGYGSDSKANSAYEGCVVVLEHLLGNGQAVTTLLGHLQCSDSGPQVGTHVMRGEVVGRVGHYWHGASRSTDWHHVHWAMRTGRFTATRYTKADIAPYVQGYAPVTEFRVDAAGLLTHPTWLDPFAVIQANGDPEAQAQAHVRHHPSGTLLQDPDGMYWMVMDDRTIASIPPATVQSDRYPTDRAVAVTQEEIACYDHAPAVSSYGPVTLYVRPGSSTVVMAFEATQERYNVISWETFLSWGFQEEDILETDQVSLYEDTYRHRGLRLLRPGTLVKAHEAPEVSIVTMQQTRLPIASEDTFERAGFQWNRIVSVPESVITEVAGPREDHSFAEEHLTQCAVPPDCPGGEASCGGGGVAQMCVPGEQALCACDQMSEGLQVCAEDGQSFAPCVCPTPEPTLEPTPVPAPTAATPASPSASSPPEPVPTSIPTPVPSSEDTQAPLTIVVKTLVNMSGFSLWLLSDSLYATPEDTGSDCVVNARMATCTVSLHTTNPLEFWMNTGVPNTPWSPGLNWETDVCDPFADVTVWRGNTPVLLQMEQVGDGCHFVIGGVP